MQTVMFTLSTIFLYAKIVSIGDYTITIGGMMGILIIALSIFINRAGLRQFTPLLLAIVAPICIYLMHVLVGSQYAIEFSRFGLSYGLWVVSMIIIWCAFQKRTVISNPNILWSLIALGGLGAAQFFGESVFHTQLAYELVAPLFSFDIFDSYIFTNQSFDRAIGTYYEPSMFGRVTATLLTMLIVQSKSFLLPLALFALSLVTTRSLGMLIFGGINISLMYREFPRRFTYMIVGLILSLAILPTFLLDRLSERRDNDVATSSTYVRLILPLEPIAELLYEYPLGLPIGSNAKFVEDAVAKGYSFAETKITNGLYELVMYFGVVSLIGIAAAIYAMIKAAATKNTTRALIIAYLLLSTAVSSSYLSIESSLLTYFFIAVVRSAGARNRDAA
jgi:hypothetical protein